MNKHPYLRAYLAGIAVPTVFLLLIMTGYTVIRYVYAVPIPIERVIVFPMAAVPNAWGLWNVLYRAFFAGRRISLGVFGGALPLLLAPGAPPMCCVMTRTSALSILKRSEEHTSELRHT